MKIQEVYIPKLKSTIIYFIGTCASDNFEIIDNSNENDIWFHVNNRPSCHVIAQIPLQLSIEKKNIKYIIKQGAVLCKQNSKYKCEKNVEIIFTKLKNIEKCEIIGSVNIRQGNNNIVKC
jgi:predicted ribosome quality control (RQC) complex YloA/Tae2 family protein